MKDYVGKKPDYQPPLYCRVCGEEVLTKTEKGRYDAQTGLRIYYDTFYCPKQDVRSESQKIGVKGTKLLSELPEDKRKHLEAFIEDGKGHTNLKLKYFKEE